MTLILLAFYFALSFLLLLFQQQNQTVSPAEGIAIGIAGVAAPLLAQLVKRLFGASGFTAVIVSFIASAAIAVVAMYMAGEIHSFGDVVKQVGAVFALSQLIYRGYIAAKESASEKPPTFN